MSLKSLIFILIHIVFYFSLSNCSMLKKSNNKLIAREMDIIKSNEYEAYCFLNINGTVYDLNSLYNPKNNYNFVDITNNNFIISFNFCKQSILQCKKKNTSALVIMSSKTDPNECYSLGGSATTVSRWTIVSKKFIL